jgi:hypothetical protein
MKIELEDTESLAAEKEKLFNELVEAAAAGKHTNFEFIRNITEMFVIKQSKKSLEKVVAVFEILSAEAYNLYCKQVRSGTDDFNLLYAYTQYKNCTKFYIDELMTANDMLNEYWNYVLSGHILSQFLLLRNRAPEDLRDFRREDQ